MDTKINATNCNKMVLYYKKSKINCTNPHNSAFKRGIFSENKIGFATLLNNLLIRSD